METLASAFIYRHTKVRIITERPTEFIDLTTRILDIGPESVQNILSFILSDADVQPVSKSLHIFHILVIVRYMPQ